VLVQSRPDRHAARRLMRQLLKEHGRAPRVLITDKLKSYAATNRDRGINVELRQHVGALAAPGCPAESFCETWVGRTAWQGDNRTGFQPDGGPPRRAAEEASEALIPTFCWQHCG
jgi:hypothetical protein